MRVGILMPHRNDREKFLSHFHFMLKNQTKQPDIIEIVDYPAKSNQIDITERYRTGYDNLRNKGLDVIAMMEVDDWYSPEYLETMCNYYEREGRPTLLGLDHTVYYNINLFKHFTMYHSTRSSAMNTLIRPDMEFNWGADNNPYADAWIWEKLKGKIVKPEKEICLGIKHGVGLCGGQSHTTHLERYVNDDQNKEFLRSIVDEKSFEFYSNYFNKNSFH